MSRPQVVRALVPRTHMDLVLNKLTTELDVDRQTIEIEKPEPGEYRDDEPNREARAIFRTGRARLIVGALLGALLGVATALLVPFLRDLLPTSAVLLAFGFGWGAAAAMFARGVQVQRDEGPRGEKVHTVGEEGGDRLVLLTIRDVRDHARVADGIAGLGVVLLDSDHPHVGRGGEGERPADRGGDDAGPPAP